jgi:hypothetical protein
VVGCTAEIFNSIYSRVGESVILRIRTITQLKQCDPAWIVQLSQVSSSCNYIYVYANEKDYMRAKI